MSRGDALTRLRQALEDRGCRVQGNAAQCPHPDHDDRHESLSIGQGRDGAVLTCQAGCERNDVVAALGLTMADLFDEPRRSGRAEAARYAYADEHGRTLFTKVRYQPKDFRICRPDGTWGIGDARRVLYRLPELTAAVAEGRHVWVVEGEKDADRLAGLGEVATCNFDGAAKDGQRPKWRPEYNAHFAGADVTIVADRDAAGLAHAQAARDGITAVARSVRIVQSATTGEHDDLSDHLNAGHTLGDLVTAGTGTGRHRTNSAPEPIEPVTLSAAIEVFRRWLHLTDIAPLLATAAALVANKAEGDPVWLLLVGAPSTGKTELLSASAGLPWIHPAARVTEASLLSGTSAKERARHATGGLLRQVGDFGVLLCKDFTSVLAQNKDASAEALAALREVYDGSWDRPVGTDGGRVLHWSGKCGLIGGVTPALDRYQAILSALGDRFLLLRLPDADQQESGKMALTHRGREKTMRADLAAALCGLVDSADPARINDPLTAGDEQRLIDLASFTARARTAVMRDGYTRELLYLPQVEGPGRLVTAYARMLGALRTIGCDDRVAWDVLHRIAVSCMTAARAAFARELASRHTAERTAELCLAVGMTTKHGRDHLEDLALLGLAERSKTSDASNAPDLWKATEALRAAKWVPINTPPWEEELKEDRVKAPEQNGSLQPPVFLGPTLPGAPMCAMHQLIGCDCGASQ